jgi:hypothetical protein
VGVDQVGAGQIHPQMSANPLPRPANESCAKNSASAGSPSGS